MTKRNTTYSIQRQNNVSLLRSIMMLSLYITSSSSFAFHPAKHVSKLRHRSNNGWTADHSNLDSSLRALMQPEEIINGDSKHQQQQAASRSSISTQQNEDDDDELIVIVSEPPSNVTELQYQLDILESSVLSSLPEQQQQQRQLPPLFVVDQLENIVRNEKDVDNRSYKLFLYDLSRAGMIGVFTGCSVAVFKLLIESLRLESYSLPFLVEPIVAALVPAFGGLVVGLLALFGPYPPGLKGIVKDTDRDSKASFLDDPCTVDDFTIVDNDNCKTKPQFSPIASLRKTVAAIFTLGTGNSLGPEGPAVEIGVNLSRFLSTSLKQIPASDVSEVIKHNRLLLACGGAAGVAAGFNAPIAGIFFALEVVQGAFLNSNNNNNSIGNNNNDSNLLSTQGGISSIVLSAVVAALISKSLLGDELVFKVREYSLATPLLELPLYLLLGSLCGVLAFSFSQLTDNSKKFFDGKLGPEPIGNIMSSIPAAVKPAIGGLFCGLVGIYYPQILFFGYETLNHLLAKTSLSTELLMTLLAVKMVSTSVAAGSGLVGGTFAPSLFFGAMAGASFHNIFAYWFDSIGDGLAGVPAYAMIGSASVLAALFRAPLTASLLLFECTREYEIILPLMASAGLASVVADFLEIQSKKNDQTLIDKNFLEMQNTLVGNDQTLSSKK